VVRAAKTQPTAADVQRFLDGIPDAKRRADARALAALMSEVTGEPPVLWGSSIVGFGAYRYRYPSGREGTSPLASFAARTGGLVVYLIGGFEDRHGQTLKQLGPHRTGKSCLYVKQLSDVDLDVLRLLIERSIAARRGVDRAGARR
jgi:hypothetical protein